ncbi:MULTISPECIES: helix-turn-helix domain-containing protein [Mumia]|uniref:helix-turn-helix domain-containing protein n=1 Tax=Mumia TaxID=1546255 RepID=UPI00141DE21B|nr:MULTISPECIES: helix-turn-helix domain-containing protein [unclassified Mumia]QMW66139.1 hypothetical protein H4N58_18690 [Mumia sp. ZJ1417]
MTGESRDVSAYERVGWLLRQWRLMSADTNLRKLQPYAEVLARHGHRADASRISRWESGRLRVPESVLRSYEEILGLPRAGLAALCEGVARSWGARPPTRTTEVSDEILSEAFATVQGSVVEGVDWFEWAGCVAARHAVDDTLAAETGPLVARLVSEASRANGLALVTRYEALRRLIESPTHQGRVMQTIGAQVIDPTAQATLIPVILIAEVRAEKAVNTLISLLGQPSAQLQLGATWGLHRKLTRHEVTPSSMAALEAQLAQILFDGSNENALVRIVPLFDVLPPQTAERLRRLRPQLFPTRPRGVAGSATSRATMLATAVRGATARIESVTGREVDAVGRAVIEDAYSATSHDVRHQSAMLLARSPYAPVLAEVLIEQTHPNRCFDGAPGVLPYVVGKAERDALITRLDESGADLRQTLVTLAHVPGGPVAGVAPLLGHADQGVAHAALFAAGMQQDPVLARLSRDRRRSAEMRAGARWWLEHGGRVDDARVT